MTTNIGLYLISLNKSTNNFEVLSISDKNFEYPKLEAIPNTSIQNICSLIYKQYLDLSENIYYCLYLDCYITNNIDIIYYCLVQNDLKKNNAYWIPFEDIKDEFHITNLQKIINLI